MSIGTFLKNKRVAVFMTQKQASGFLGLKNQQFLSNIERGTRNPPVELLKEMCTVYNVSDEDMRAEFIENSSENAKARAKLKWEESNQSDQISQN